MKPHKYLYGSSTYREEARKKKGKNSVISSSNKSQGKEEEKKTEDNYSLGFLQKGHTFWLGGNSPERDGRMISTPEHGI